MTKSKTINIIISVLISILLWIYVINVVNPPATETIREIPVQLSGLDSLEAGHLTIAGDGYYTVDVTVSAPRAELAGISQKDITASASLLGLTAGQNYINVNVSVPDNITLDDVRSQKIQVYIDELVEVDKPVYIAHQDAPEGTEITITDSSHETVKVIGADSIVKLVEQVRVDLDISDMEVDSVKTAELDAIPLDSDGNIVKNVSLETELISVTAAEYAIKTVPLRVSYVGSPGPSTELKDAKLPGRVNIKGPSDRLDAVESVSARVISIEGITQDTSYKIDCDLMDGIYLADSSQGLRAYFTVTQLGDISFTYGIDDVVKEGGSEGESYSFEDASITVTASGELDKVKALQVTDLMPHVDLSGFDAGVYDLPISIPYTQEGVSLSVTPDSIRVTVGTVNVPDHSEEGNEGSGSREDASDEGGSGEGSSGESGE